MIQILNVFKKKKKNSFIILSCLFLSWFVAAMLFERGANASVHHHANAAQYTSANARANANTAHAGANTAPARRNQYLLTRNNTHTSPHHWRRRV